MGDPLKERLSAEIIKIIDSHDLWEMAAGLAAVVSVLMGAGAFLLWVYKRAEHHAALAKARAEGEKLALEAASVRLEATLKRQTNRNKYDVASETLALHLRAWFELGKANDVPAMDAAREESLNCLSASVIPAFRDYAEIQFASLPKFERRLFVENEVLPFLKTLLGFLSGVNHSPILARLGRKPFYLKETHPRKHNRPSVSSFPIVEV